MKMKTIWVDEPGKISIKESELPVPAGGDALLKIKYCGICGSDVLLYRGDHFFASYPRVPGHEFSAEIVEIGENEYGLENGMLVTANPYFNCGSCHPCSIGKVNCCEDNQTMGVQRDGSFAEYIVMPVERIRKGRGISAKELALIEPFSIGYHAVKRGQVTAGDTVLVMGAGPIGLFAMISAKLMGASVYVSDIMPGRLEFAKKMGADGVLNASDEETAARIDDITGGSGMDVCVEATGNPKALMNCIEYVSYGGRLALVGNGKQEVTFNHSILLKKELELYGSRNSLNDFNTLIREVESGRAGILDMVTSVYPFEKAEDALEALVNNDGSRMKILLDFNS